MRAFVSFSGGKESVFAFFHALRQGIKVEVLFTMLNSKGKKTRGHGLHKDLIMAQAQALRVPVVFANASWRRYEETFKRVLRKFRANGIEAGVFGDLYLEEHREWVERVCNEVGLKPILPLWGQDPDGLLQEFLSHGFKAVLVAIKDQRIPVELLGKFLEEEVIKSLKEIGVDPCGERGEYHTLVVDGPLFSRSLSIEAFKKRKGKKGIFLEILKFTLLDKDTSVSL